MSVKNNAKNYTFLDKHSVFLIYYILGCVVAFMSIWPNASLPLVIFIFFDYVHFIKLDQRTCVMMREKFPWWTNMYDNLLLKLLGVMQYWNLNKVPCTNDTKYIIWDQENNSWWWLWIVLWVSLCVCVCGQSCASVGMDVSVW